MDYEKINPKCEPLTIEILKKFPGYENYTDEQAQEVVDSLDIFAKILYDHASKA